MFGGISLFAFPRPLEAWALAIVGGSFIAPVVARHPERYKALKFGKGNQVDSVALARLGDWNTDILQSFRRLGQNGQNRPTVARVRKTRFQPPSKSSARLRDRVMYSGERLTSSRYVDFTKSNDFTGTIASRRTMRLH